MIYFSLGLPGRVANWCDAAIKKLLAHDEERVAYLHFPANGVLPDYRDTSTAVNELALCLVRTNASHLVIGVHEPDERLKKLLVDTSPRFVLALEDPRAVMADFCEQGGHDVKSATRAIANSCPFIMDCMDLPGVLSLRAEDLSDGGYTALSAIASHLNIPFDEHAASEIIQALKEHFPPQEYWASRISAEEEHKMVDGALGAYAALFAGAEFGNLVWTRELFRFGDPQHSLDRPIPLRKVGNGLYLVYGPYMRLPSGYWSAKVLIGVSAETVGQTFTIDAYCDYSLATEKFSPRASGIFTVQLDFTTDDVSGKNIEIRITVGRNSAPGELAFGHVAIHPIALRHSGQILEQQGDYRMVLQS